jgi:outer membrane protein
MKRGKLWSGTGAIALLVALPASGADLLSVYDQALVNDPIIREAEANRRAQRESRPQAIANLLPAASASAGKSRSWSDGTGFQQFTFAGDAFPTSSDNSGRSINNSKTWSLQLRQSVFSWANWIALRTANSEVAQAESDYLAQLQGLAQRVGQQYFAVLQSRDTVEAQEAARDAISRQLEQSERRFEVGLIAITDVQEARALASAEEQLRATIGEKPVSLNEPAEDMPLLSPDPASEEDWVRVSMEQNATLISSRIAADIARDSVRSSYGGYMPSVDLVAGRSYSDADGRRIATNGQVTTSGSETYGKSVALQFSVNLNGLGYGTYSRTKQSEYLWIAAKERLERTSRNTEREARDAYLGVNSEIARVQALKQALESSRTALAATEAGYEVGTRTAVDVLTSRRLLIQAETNYSAAKYSYLNNLIQLRMAAGDLDRSTLEEINRWLTVPQPTTP